MKDGNGKRRPETPDEQPAETSGDSPMASYTPEQRRLVRRGLRIWARVAIRSYMRKRGAIPPRPETPEDTDEEVGR